MHHHFLPESLQLASLWRVSIFEGFAGGHHALQVLVSDDCVLRELILVRNDGNLLSNGHTGVRVITSDHNHLDASVLAILHSLLDARLWRVLNAEETDEDHVLQEVILGVFHRGTIPLVVGVVVGLLLCDAQDSLGLTHQGFAVLFNNLLDLRCDLDNASRITAADVDVLAEAQDSLGSALQREELTAFGVRLCHKHVLVGRVEGNLIESGLIHDVLHSLHSPR
mmetsp:Transcript_93778/g.195585  ORF Transcript_93778/g.195585 Transcript_93778/m.195585 type:complete len:224 (-) Transcript_93778:1677-2348(-)